MKSPFSSRTARVLPVVLLLLSATGCGPKETRIRVASFNLRVDTPDDGDNSWSHRKERARDILFRHDLDIVGTQEGLKHQLTDLTDDGGYAYAGVGRDDGADGGEHAAILYKPERFDLLDSGNFWYSETPGQPSYGWDAACRRVCTWARFREGKSGKEFYVFNSHFDHISTTARRESANMLLERVKAVAGDVPVFCTGDFNGSEESEPIRIIREDGALLDSKTVAAEVSEKPRRTFHAYDLEPTPDERIDFIFVTPGVTVESYDVLTDRENGRYPSDHYPVVADVLF